MKIFDAHMHVGGYLSPNPERLIQDMEKAGVSGGCIMSIDPADPNFSYEQRMENLFSWVKGYEDRLFPVAWMHPHEESIEEKILDAIARGVAAFKFIPDTYNVAEEKAQRVFRLIEAHDLPIFFHSGILYDFNVSSSNNRPALWENLMQFQKLRFSMAHCGNPWVDECLSLYGKFNWIEHHTRAAARGEYTIYKDFPWVKNHLAETDGQITWQTPQLYLDTTPGAHGKMREDMLQKIHDRSPIARKVFWGSDLYVDQYSSETIRQWLAEENKAPDSIGASQEFRENMYGKNILRFLNRCGE